MMHAHEIQIVNLMELRPNNWYINKAKLNKIREVWRRKEQTRLPPVLVTRIDAEFSLIDGHSRAYAAYEQSVSKIAATIRDLHKIEGSQALYEHIHREGPGIGIRTIADLKDRIVEAELHKQLWVGYCTKWLAENEEV